MITVFSLAFAEEPAAPAFRVTYDAMAVARVNPLGTQLKGSLHFRHRLVAADADSVLFGDTWVSAGPLGAVTPAWARGGAFVQVSPIALLRATAAWEAIGYFGTFGQVQGFADPGSADFSDDALDAGDGRPTGGSLVTLEGRAQAKVGPVAVRDTLTAIHLDIGLPDGDVAFYDQMMDSLVPGDGWMLMNDADLLLTGKRWAAGLRYTHTAPMHADDAARQRTSIDRAGLLASWRFQAKRGSGFDQPTIFLLSQWHLRHEYRTGQEVSQWIPYLGAGFSFTGDVKRWRSEPAGSARL